MAYQDTYHHTSYGARAMYNPGNGQHPSHPQLYPDAYPQSQSPSHPSAPSFSYVQPPGPGGQINNAPRQQYLPNQNSGIAVPPATLPDETFKRPYLPPKADPPRPSPQYTQHAQAPPNNFSYPATSTASSTPTAATFPAQNQSKQSLSASSSYPASSMTVSAPPAISSAQSTPVSEAPSQPTDSAPQITKLSPLDQERVDALLNVNNLLLQELQALQKAGLKMGQPGNPQSPQQANAANASSPQSKTEGTDTTPTSTDPPVAAGANPSTNSTSTTPTTTTPTTGVSQQTYNQKKFVEYMKRLQSNILYLVSITDTTGQRQRAPYPSHLEMLSNWLAEGMKEEEKPQFEALKEGYSKLRELWPDWKPGPPALNPQQQQAQAQAQAQNRQQQQGSAQLVQQPQAQSQVSGKS